MMRHACYTLYIIITTFILTGCGGRSEFRQTLELLDSVLVSRPDSVYDVLNKLEPQKQSEADRMYYELLRADAQNKAYIDFTTDSVMKIVADYYDHHGNANEQMRAHYLLGCTYRDLQDVPMELQCFQEAVEKADTTKTDCDLYTLAAIYGQMADIYHDQYLPEEELNTLAMCEKIAFLDNDTITEITAYELRLRAYVLEERLDSIISIASNSHDRYLAIGDKKRAACLLNPMISSLIEKGEYTTAKKLMKEFIEYSGNFDDNGNVSSNGAVALSNVGLIYLHENKYDSAKYCFEHLLDFGETVFAYGGLLSLYEKKQNSDSIAKYARLYIKANDSTYIGRNSHTIEQMTAMYNYGHQSNIAKQNEIKAKEIHQRLYLYISISIIVLIILISIGLKIKQSKDKEIIEMTKSYYDLLSQKATLTKEINALTTSQKENIENNKKLLEQKEKEVIALQHIVDSYSCKLNLDDFIKRQKAFEATNIFIRMKQSTRFKDNINKLTNSEWEQFDHLYKQYFPEYYARITKNAQLNNDEKRVCLLLIFCLSPKELSAILNKTKPRISNIRSSINKKLFNVDSAISLDENIRRLF